VKARETRIHDVLAGREQKAVLLRAEPGVDWRSTMPPVEQLVEQFPYAGLVLLVVLGAMGLPFPEDATLLLCGFLIGQDAIEALPAILLLYPSVLVVDLALFGLGRKYGPAVNERRPFRWILTRERLVRIEEMFRKWGILAIVVGRQLVGLRAQILIAAGVFRMKPLVFLAADAVSLLATMAIMVGAGYLGGSSFAAIRKGVARVEHVATLVAIGALLVGLIVLYVRTRKKG